MKFPLFVARIGPAQIEPDTQSVEGIKQVETVFYNVHGSKRLVRRNPQADGGNVHRHPENPLFHIGRGHKELADYIAHQRNHIQQYRHPEEPLRGAAVKLQDNKVKDYGGS